MRLRASLSIRSVSVSVEVPEVMKISLGSLLFKSSGMAFVVSTCVPETLVSHDAFQASRTLILPSRISTSKLAPPLLTSTSRRPYLSAMCPKVLSMEASEARSTLTTESVLADFKISDLTDSMALSPLLGVRQPMIIS